MWNISCPVAALEFKSGVMVRCEDLEDIYFYVTFLAFPCDQANGPCLKPPRRQADRTSPTEDDSNAFRCGINSSIPNTHVLFAEHSLIYSPSVSIVTCCCSQPNSLKLIHSLVYEFIHCQIKAACAKRGSWRHLPASRTRTAWCASTASASAPRAAARAGRSTLKSPSAPTPVSRMCNR